MCFFLVSEVLGRLKKRAMLGLAALAIFPRFRYLKVDVPPGHFGHFHYERPKLKFIWFV